LDFVILKSENLHRKHFNNTQMKINHHITNVGYLLRETYTEFIDDSTMKLSAALSYYTIFSLPPLLIIIISLCGFLFGEDAVRGELFGQINGVVGNDVAIQIQSAIRNVTLSRSNTFFTTIGIIMLVVGASGVFSEIQDSINMIWGIETKPKRGLIRFILNRLVSFIMIVSVGLLLILGLLTNSLMDLLSTKLTMHFPQETIFLMYGLNILIVFVLLALLFTIIFKILPDGKIAFSDCMIGASLTAFLFMIGKIAIGAYLSSFAIATVYGAAGSVILLLAWVYYSAIILYFGAEFTRVYAEKHGKKIIPNGYSVLVKKHKTRVIEEVGFQKRCNNKNS
jgi:membrane protein